MDLKKIGTYAYVCARWLVLAVLVGCIIGPCGAAFGLLLHGEEHFFAENHWLIWLLPVFGLIIVACYRFSKYPGGGSTNAVFKAVRDDEPMPLRAAPLIVIATALTHLGGGSSGREGAALQMGGSIAGRLGRFLRLDTADCRVMTLCGMSAAFSAIFGTPLAAAVFSLEVISVGTVYYVALVPCMLAALVGLWIAGVMGLAPTSYSLMVTVELTPASMLQVIVLSALVAVLSILVCQVLHSSAHLYAHVFPNPYIRVAAAGGLVVGATLLLGTWDYNGAGGHVIAQAIAGSAVPYAFVLKLIFTSMTLGAGYKGGEIVPVFFIGSTFGCTVAPLLGLPAPVGAALGMIGLFCGVSNCPIASTLLAMELFGGKCMPLFALTCALSYMMSGYFGLYSEQKIMFSKLRDELIDRKLD